jgi:uncharacterized protein
VKRIRFDYAGPIRLVTDEHTPEQVAQLRRDGLTATRTKEGFLRVEGRIMRVGALVYSDGVSSWGEFRSRESIDAALDSFKLAPVTLGHPDQLVTVDNISHVQQGHLGSTLGWDPILGDHVRADFLVTHREALDAIDRGIAELSVGFVANVVPRVGKDANGQPYVFEQTDLEGNHVAIVVEGRAGKDARLLLDSANGAAYQVVDINTSSRKTKMLTKDIIIDGVKHTVPAAVADAYEAQQQLLDEAAKEEEDEEEEGGPPKKKDEAEPTVDSSEVVKLRARCDKQEAELAELKADAQRRRRDELLADARRAGVEIDLKACKTDAQIMRAIVLAKLPALAPRLDANAGESGYLRAMFDEVMDGAARERSNTITSAVNQAVKDAAGDNNDFFDSMDEWTTRAAASGGE